jgi:Ca2+-binding RTX toxin-like protein
MPTYSLSQKFIDYPFPWNSSVFIWDRQGVITEGADQYLLIKISAGGLQNAAPAPLLAYKVSTSGFIDCTTQLFGKIPQFSIVRELIVKDINGDGYDDIFLSNQGPEPSSGLFPGEQNAIYIYQPETKNFKEIITPGSDFSHGSAIGDFDGDGILDIFVNNLGSTSGIRSYVLKQESNGIFTSKALAEFFLNTVGPLNAAIDINKDGKSELAGIDQNGSLIIWQNILGSTPTQIGLPTVLPTSAKGIFEIRSADLDGNGKADIVVTGTDDGIVNSNGVTVGGVLKAAIIFDAGLPSQRVVEPLKTADINLICQGGVRIELVKFDNSGAISFELRTYDSNWHFRDFTVYVDSIGNTKVSDTSILVSAVSAAYIDVNADGILDLVADNYSTVRVRYGILASDSAPVSTKINGTPYNDRIFGTQGNDTIDGEAGIDTVSYSGIKSNYTIIRGNSNVTVSSGADGLDTLVNVERLKFSDSALALDIDGTAGQCYRIYKAAFARTPDLGGVGYWISVMDKGTSLQSVAGGFIDSSEFKSVYGANPSNDALVTKFYTNVLGRAPDAKGAEYWTGILNNKQDTVANVLANISESAENKASLVGVIGNGFEYIPYG